MTPMTFLLLFFSSLAFLTITAADYRAPHGLSYENPMAFPPSAVEFFHPKADHNDTKTTPCAAPSCTWPMAAQVEAAQAQDSKASATQKGGSRVGAGAIVGIVFGLVFIVVAAMGVYYVLIARRTNMNRANSAQPNA